MPDGEGNSWRLRSGPYLGEFSALSFLPLPSCLSSFPLLLAGTGSQLLVYDVESGNLLNSLNVFQGVRVHGISLRSLDSKDSFSPASACFLIAVYGERTVKLFLLRVDAVSSSRVGDEAGIGLKLVCRLPAFDHWVLDACFLKEDNILVLGLSDNSVALWDLSMSNVVSRVKSSERCLLYSMRMWGDSMKTLRVASGTIFNEIVIWKLIPHASLPLSKSVKESYNPSISGQTKTGLHDQQYMAMHLSRLTGHEGSIFRITWSADGSKLMSVSDDRSARVWIVGDQRQDFGDLSKVPAYHVPANLTLFGHNARIWDCYISDSIVITAGEDCTCRVWGMDGNQLMMFKEHIGRGIWRCEYDPSSSLLVTAGFDSAIKVHQLHFSSYGEAVEQNGVSNELKDQTEIFQICAPKVSKHLGLMDSKSEYVRCLQFTQENILYVATNNGILHCTQLCSPWDVRWTELAQVSEDTPIICMDIIMVMNSSENSLDREDIVAVGDGKGNVTVIRLINEDTTPSVALSFTWSAEKERQLLGVYWCKSLGCSHLFTADPRGTLKFWKINDALLSDSHDTTADPKVFLIAAYTSCFGARIMCINASVEEEILICGDRRGNLTVFPLLESMMASSCSETVEIPVINSFKGAHGISSVTSIYVGTPNLDNVEIRTTGGDGCICNFKYDKNVQELEFIGMKQVKELSTIQSVVTKSNYEDLTNVDLLALGSYTIGFTSVDFIMWDLTNETKTIQIPCGGWRRPYSYHLGAVPEYQNCFAYLKDHTIHIHRLWLSSVESKLFPRILHMQSHGREVHSLHFIFPELLSNPKRSHYLWVATGCEDGTVRLTRYAPFDMGSWCESKLLGEHVGGSAVRSLCFIPKIYTFRCETYYGSGKCICHPSIPRKDDQFLLISVGSKQVLTCWLFRNETLGSELAESECLSVPWKRDFSSISFQWLSAHIPPKFSSSQRRVEKLMEIFEKENSFTVESTPFCRSHSAEIKKQVKSAFIDQTENDWRYLAVTAFLVKHTDSRLTVCFITVACSDATVTLRALLLPYRLWFDVALLVPQTSPVLALQHIVVAGHSHSKGDAHNRNVYIVISGSTDGSITFWDVTEVVECFMQLVLEVQPRMLIDCQRRPQTGRGSQGGRWWRSMTTPYSKMGVQHGLIRIKDGNDVNGPSSDKTANKCTLVEESDAVNGQTSCRQTTGSCHMPERVSNVSASEICEVQPFYVLNSVHQSGVNCLHISEMKNSFHSKPEGAYCVLSGGDDQAVHCVCFKLEVHLTDMASKPGNLAKEDETVQQPLRSNFTSKCPLLSLNNETTKIEILNLDRVASAHSSAVKGIWTDGIWAFSTGLDQRIRCWQIDHHGILTEHSHLIISVPEPETMDAMICDSKRNRYQIVVGGRGMQIVEFYASYEEDE